MNMKNTQKGFATAVFIIVIIGLVGIAGTYYLTKRKQDVNISINTTSTTSVATETSKKAVVHNSDILSARDVLTKIQEIYSPNSLIENHIMMGYNEQTKGYILIVKSEDVTKIEEYLKSELSLKTVNASELGYTFEESKSNFKCETSTGRPEIETESGFSSATEAYVFCYDIKL